MLSRPTSGLRPTGSRRTRFVNDPLDEAGGAQALRRTRRCAELGISAGRLIAFWNEILRELPGAYEIEPVRPRPELRPRGIIKAFSHGSRTRVGARAS
jgi:hypothetical protein